MVKYFLTHVSGHKRRQAYLKQRSRKKERYYFVFAVIKTGGKQYKVTEGEVIFVEKLDLEEGATVNFDQVLAVSGNELKVGTPFVDGASVSATVLKNGKTKKIYVLKYKSKKNEKKKIGHRQAYTKVQINKIVG